MTKSAAFNTPILVNNKFLMAERVKKYGLGISFNESLNLELDLYMNKLKKLDCKCK